MSADLKALCDAATPGPWEVGGPYPQVSVIKVDHETYDASTNTADCYPVCIVTDKTTRERCSDDPDAAFIAAARTAVPALLAEVDGLAKANMRLTEERDSWRRSYMTVADAIAPGSASTAELAGIAREARADNDALRAENERMRAALEAAKRLDESLQIKHWGRSGCESYSQEHEDLRKALAALTPPPSESKDSVAWCDAKSNGEPK